MLFGWKQCLICILTGHIISGKTLSPIQRAREHLHLGMDNGMKSSRNLSSATSGESAGKKPSAVSSFWDETLGLHLQESEDKPVLAQSAAPVYAVPLRESQAPRDDDLSSLLSGSQSLEDLSGSGPQSRRVTVGSTSSSTVGPRVSRSAAESFSQLEVDALCLDMA